MYKKYYFAFLLKNSISFSLEEKEKIYDYVISHDVDIDYYINVLENEQKKLKNIDKKYETGLLKLKNEYFNDLYNKIKEEKENKKKYKIKQEELDKKNADLLLKNL